MYLWAAAVCCPTGKWEGADNGMSLKASLQWKRAPGSSGGVPGDSGNVLRSFYLPVLTALPHVLWPPPFPLISQVYPPLLPPPLYLGKRLQKVLSATGPLTLASKPQALVLGVSPWTLHRPSPLTVEIFTLT